MKQLTIPTRLTILLTAFCLFPLPSALGQDQGNMPEGMLLPGGKNVQGMFRMNDSRGGLWGINLQYGFVQESTNNVYGSGMYMHIQGNNFYSPTNAGTLNEAGDEVQIGPWNYQNLIVYRRIKVYRKEGLARWLDIIHNPGPAKQINVMIRTHMNYGINSLETDRGKTSFSKDDFAFITTCNNANIPATLHIVNGPKSPLRPTVMQQGNRCDITYTFTIPAGGTAILLAFEAQRGDASNLKEIMKGFRPQKYLRDLPAKIRRLIVNARATGGVDDLDLERNNRADRVVLRDDQEFLGKIDTPSFTLKTISGELTLPAQRVVGMVAWGDEPGKMRALLSDGQVVTGDSGEQTLKIQIPNVGEQTIPLQDIRTWSYRVSKDHPDEQTYTGPYLKLRTGDRLAFDAASVPFQLQTRNGLVTLDPAAVLAIQLDNEDHNLHRVTFRNGSELSGLLLPASIEPKLQLGSQQAISRDLLVGVEYAAEENDAADLPKLTLADGDVLRGVFDQKDITLKGKYGVMTLQPANIRLLQSIPDRAGYFRATLWNGSTVQGQLQADRLTFQIQPGPALTIDTARIVSFDQPSVLPPADVIRGVAELVVQLGAESYKDRQAAQDKLIKMGPNVVPVLKQHLQNKDPEIRQRVREIIDQLTAVG